LVLVCAVVGACGGPSPLGDAGQKSGAGGGGAPPTVDAGSGDRGGSDGGGASAGSGGASGNGGSGGSGVDGGNGIDGGGGAGGASDGGLDGAPPACPAEPSCGGDVVGTWQITSSCVSFTLDLSSACPGLTADGTFTFSGGVTYGADMTYVQTGTAGGSVQYHFPPACLQQATCAATGAALMQASIDQGGTFSSISCIDAAGGGCTCPGTLVDSPNDQTGTYTATGGVLTSIPQGGTAGQAPYCVTGNQMVQGSGLAGNPMGAPSSAITGTITLTKS
jgi:hypothetical protein